MSPRERSLKNKEVKRNEFAIYWSQKKLTYIYNRRVFFWKINFNAVDFVWFFLVSENYSSRLLVPIRLSIILYDGERQKKWKRGEACHNMNKRAEIRIQIIRKF